VKAVLCAFVEAMNARNWPALRELLAPDLVFELPQRGERIDGRDRYLAFNAEGGGEWRIEPTVILADDTDGCLQFRWHDAEGDSLAMAFFTFAGGRIATITDFFPRQE
jgi:hypothetical protein